MRKLLLPCLLAAFALAGCEKDYTCSCKVSNKNTKEEVTETHVIHESESEAEAQCEKGDSTYVEKPDTLVSDCDVQ